MKLTIKANEKITSVLVRKVNRHSGDIYSIEFDFEKSYPWSDLEMWLDDENGNVCDYAKMNVSKRNKMQFAK